MAKDLYHNAVKNALIFENWLITEDPYQLEVWDSPSYDIDLAAEKIIAAQRENYKIAVEVKSFTAPSTAHEFHKALGQYLNYQSFMEIQEPERKLYLAVVAQIYDDFFTKKSTQYILDKFKVSVIVFNAQNEKIERWLER
jgi:hypothetical protein